MSGRSVQFVFLSLFVGDKSPYHSLTCAHGFSKGFASTERQRLYCKAILERVGFRNIFA